MNRLSTRSTVVVTVVSVLLLSFANLAIAQSQTTVSVSTGSGTRLLSVTDLANQPLTAMALQPGVAKSFRVRIDDDALNTLEQKAFTVDAVMNNLYLKTGASSYDYGSTIPAGQVSVSFLPDPVDATGLLADVSPDYLLSSTQKLTCDGVLGGVLGLDLTNLSLLDPVYQALCDSLGGLLSLDPTAGIHVTDVPVAGEVIAALDLSGLTVSQLPIVAGLDATALAGGAFTDADYSNGTIGFDDPSKPATPTPTSRRLLTGGLNTDLSALAALVQAQVDALNVVSLDGSGAMMSVSDAVAAMRASASAEVSGFADALSQLSGSEQLNVLAALFDAVLDTLGADDLLSLSSFYTSLPRLTATATGVAAGQYAGTLTVTVTES